VQQNATHAFAATGFDQFGDALAAQPAFAWDVSAGIGSIDAAGVYTSPTGTGSATVRASSGGVSDTAIVTVDNQPPTIATAAAATPSPVVGTTAALSVLGADDAGESNLTYTWSVTGKPAGATDPTFSTNGTNAAKSVSATFGKAGSYTLRATVPTACNRSRAT
jgi:hypothetical protein